MRWRWALLALSLWPAPARADRLRPLPPAAERALQEDDGAALQELIEGALQRDPERAELLLRLTEERPLAFARTLPAVDRWGALPVVDPWSGRLLGRWQQLRLLSLGALEEAAAQPAARGQVVQLLKARLPGEGVWHEHRAAASPPATGWGPVEARWGLFSWPADPEHPILWLSGRFELDSDDELLLWLEGNERSAVFVDGHRVLERDPRGRRPPAESVVALDLAAGSHELLVRVVGSRGSELGLALTDRAGRARVRVEPAAPSQPWTAGSVPGIRALPPPTPAQRVLRDGAGWSRLPDSVEGLRWRARALQRDTSLPLESATERSRVVWQRLGRRRPRDPEARARRLRALDPTALLSVVGSHEASLAAGRLALEALHALERGVEADQLLAQLRVRYPDDRDLARRALQRAGSDGPVASRGPALDDLLARVDPAAPQEQAEWWLLAGQPEEARSWLHRLDELHWPGAAEQLAPLLRPAEQRALALRTLERDPTRSWAADLLLDQAAELEPSELALALAALRDRERRAVLERVLDLGRPPVAHGWPDPAEVWAGWSPGAGAGWDATIALDWRELRLEPDGALLERSYRLARIEQPTAVDRYAVHAVGASEEVVRFRITQTIGGPWAEAEDPADTGSLMLPDAVPGAWVELATERRRPAGPRRLGFVDETQLLASQADQVDHLVRRWCLPPGPLWLRLGPEALDLPRADDGCIEWTGRAIEPVPTEALMAAPAERLGSLSFSWRRGPAARRRRLAERVVARARSADLIEEAVAAVGRAPEALYRRAVEVEPVGGPLGTSAVESLALEAGSPVLTFYALLQQAGVEASLWLVQPHEASPGPLIDGGQPLVRIKTDSGSRWFDPGPDRPFGWLRPGLRDRPAVRLLPLEDVPGAQRAQTGSGTDQRPPELALSGRLRWSEAGDAVAGRLLLRLFQGEQSWLMGWWARQSEGSRLPLMERWLGAVLPGLGVATALLEEREGGIEIELVVSGVQAGRWLPGGLPGLRGPSPVPALAAPRRGLALLPGWQERVEIELVGQPEALVEGWPSTALQRPWLQLDQRAEPTADGVRLWRQVTLDAARVAPSELDPLAPELAAWLATAGLTPPS